MTGAADIKPGILPLLVAQAAHPLLLAILTAIGPPHRLHHEGGASDGDPAARHSWLLSSSNQPSDTCESDGLSHCFPLLREMSWYANFRLKQTE